MGKTIIKKFGLITSLFILSQNQKIRQKKENEKIADLAREIGKNLAKNK